MKVFIQTLGCEKNTVDSENAASLLCASGCTIVDEPYDADVFIVNTCGFIKDAKQQSIEAIFDLSRIKSKCRKLIVTGCLSQRYAKELQKESYLLVDGYNIINAWPDLKNLAAENLESARIRLLDIMCNYQGFRQMTLIVVFDAYRVPGRKRDVSEYNNIYVVYTKEAETADQYIEKTVHKLGKHHNVTVATSDALEQIIIFGEGAVRLSAAGLREEVEHAESEIRDMLE